MTDRTYAFKPNAATVPEGDQIALRALRVTAFEYTDVLFWRVDDDILSVSVECSDVFFWGSADVEPLTVKNIDLFEATYAECEDRFGKYNAEHATELFCARARNTRPQGAFYKYLSPEWAELFNAAGPERETGLGNPYTPEQAMEQARVDAQERRDALARRQPENAADAAGTTS